jgi:hypothetical protein
MDERQKVQARRELERWKTEHRLSKSELWRRKSVRANCYAPLSKAERKRRDERRQAVLDGRQLRVPLLKGAQ